MAPIIIFMTATSKSEARRIVKNLLEKRIIACANIYSPVESYFWWQGKIDKANEVLVLLKSDQRLFTKLSKAIKEMHSYDVPEILAVPVLEGFPRYLEWLNTALTNTVNREKHDQKTSETRRAS